MAGFMKDNPGGPEFDMFPEKAKHIEVDQTGTLAF